MNWQDIEFTEEEVHEFFKEVNADAIIEAICFGYDGENQKENDVKRCSRIDGN